MTPDTQLQNGTDVQINPSASSAPGAPVSSPAQAPVQRGTLQFLTPSRLSPEQDFKLEVKVTDVKDLSSAPFTVTYDPAFVTFVSASEGNFLKRGGGATTFTSINEAASGTLTINNSRSAGTGGVSGSGTLASLVFRAKTNKGGAGFGFSNVNFSTVTGTSHPMLPFNTAVEIK
jgi:general secretion pathway protein D